VPAFGVVGTKRVEMQVHSDDNPMRGLDVSLIRYIDVLDEWSGKVGNWRTYNYVDRHLVMLR